MRRRTGSRAALGLCAIAVVLAASPDAGANGRFPRSERLLEDPSDPSHLLLAATYGVLTTTDRGAHWYDFCEAQFAGDAQYAGDPLIDFVGGAASPLAVLVDSQAVISRSADFCAWSPTLGSVGSNQNINDFSIDRARRTTVVAVVTRIVEGGLSVGLQESTDAGASWHAIGSPLPLQTVTTVDLDPTDPTHIYATGLIRADGGQQGALLKSVDHGATWSILPIPGTDNSNVPYIAAVHPQDASRIFVRTNATILPADAPEESANDALLYTSDGGATWREVLRQSARLLGFALSPDGTQVLAGYGDPVESGIFVDPTVTGVYAASAADLSFTPVYSGSVTCLTWTAQGVYACTAQQASGTIAELAFFAGGDLVSDSGSPTYVMKLDEVSGPPPCCGAAAAACVWPTLCVTYPFFACGDAGPPPASCDASAPAVVDSGGDAASVAPADAARDSTAGEPATFGQQAAGASGCSCREAPTASRTAAQAWRWSIVLLLWLALGRRVRGAGGRRVRATASAPRRVAGLPAQRGSAGRRAAAARS